MSALTVGRCFGEGDDPVAPGTSCVCAQVFAWDTQTANQAIGTGALLVYGHRLPWVYVGARFECLYQVMFRADQSARIGFGAL